MSLPNRKELEFILRKTSQCDYCEGKEGEYQKALEALAIAYIEGKLVEPLDVTQDAFATVVMTCIPSIKGDELTSLIMALTGRIPRKGLDVEKVARIIREYHHTDNVSTARLICEAFDRWEL